MLNREKIMDAFVDYTKMIKNPHIEEIKELAKDMEGPALKAFFMSYYAGAHDMKDRILKAIDGLSDEEMASISDIVAGM